MNLRFQPSVRTASGLLVAVCLISACEASSREPSGGSNAVMISEPAKNTDTITMLDTRDQEPPAESEEAVLLALERARIACRSGEFRSFFDVLVASPSALLVYSAPSIELSRFTADGRQVEARNAPAEAYASFPIRMEDYYRRPSAGVRGAGPDEYIELAFDQSQSDVFVVSWTRVRYDGESEGGDDLGRALTPDGRPVPDGYAADGTLRFAPQEGCWRLVADERYDR